MDLEALKKIINSALASLEKNYNEHEGSSYLPQLNFYKIHGLATKENYHSKFITFLLNPKKQHGCCNNFLKPFIEILNNKIESENLKLSSLVLDYYQEAKAETGSIINKKQKSGGRVDIRIFNTENDKTNNIIIENKITAPDQNAQLARYHKAYPSSTIIYLTLLGDSASPNSLSNELKEDEYVKLSYRKDIKNWLNECLKYLQECNLDVEKKKKLIILLNDYLTIIKELTYREERKKEIFSKLSNNLETVEFVLDIKNRSKINEITGYKNKNRDTIILLKNYLIREKFIKIILDKLLDDLKTTISNDFKLNINDTRRIMQKGWGFQFYKEKWKDYNIKIGFIFCKRHLEDCNFGFRKYDPTDKFIPEEYAHKYKDNKLIKNIWYSLEPMPEKIEKPEKPEEPENYRDWHKDLFKQFYQFMPNYKEKSNFYNWIKEKIEGKCKEIEENIIK